jgi:hypothetical protein
MLFKKKLLILPCFLVILNLALLVFFLRTKNQKQEKDSITSQNAGKEAWLITGIPQSLESFVDPLSTTQIESSVLIQVDFGVDSLGFKAKEGSTVLAGFEGYVNLAGQETDQQLIMLTSLNDSKIMWKYLFTGDFLVKEGEMVEAGSSLAKLKGSLPTRKQNLIIMAYTDGKPTSFNQSDLESFIK